MHSIEDAFGESCSLYTDVLQCPSTADAAQLRKAYYRAALKVHPDKNPGNEAAQRKFQALSAAYQILQDEELRKEYDETGVIPHADADGEATEEGVDAWKSYFDQIFGKVTLSKINDFASKYKCSDEERRDVLKEFKKHKGNLVKMLDFVMLSEARDALRWVTDYLQPALEEDSSLQSCKTSMDKSMKKIQKMVDKENEEKQKEADEDEDEEETETEEEDDDDEEAKPKAPPIGRFQKPPSPKKPPAKKKRKTKASVSSNMDDLVAQIQNKRRGGGSVLASLGARYGVAIDDDPLTDADFSKMQSKYKKTRHK
jgi:DnaJ family protein C protein 9